MPSTPRDPRPLVGEPISVDLMNTVWRDAAGEHDLLATRGGLRIWLASAGSHGARPTEDTRRALLAAREALLAHVDRDPSAAPGRAAAAINAVLARGSLVRRLGDGGPETAAAVGDDTWRPAWAAAEDYLRLLERGSDRLRRCSHEDCVLHFYDTSKKGDRRWCSMAVCGNRAKAARHYARRRAEP